jgi:cyclase
MPSRIALPCLFLSLLALSVPLTTQDADVTIEVIPVAGNVSMLVGQGGNMGLSTGEDGAFLIDDQFAPLTDKILAAVASVTDQPVRWLVNTHWHGDHTGGNENLGNKGVLLVAHDNVRERMSAEQVMEAFGRTVPPSPDAALPKITFTDAVTFYWNGNTVHAFHVADAHTDGDAIIHFRNANVIHMGDTFFNGSYPFIDTSTGGRINGVINAADRVLMLCNEETKLIPGHGPLGTPDDLRAYRSMLVDARDKIRTLISAGKTMEETVAAKPTAHLDGEWGNGFMAPDQWVGIVYTSMAVR